MRGRIRVRLLVATWVLVSFCVYVSLAAVGHANGGATTLLVSLAAGGLVGFIVSELAVRWFDETVRPLTDAAKRMHDGDLTVRARVAREQDVGQLGAAFDQLAGSLSQTVGELRSERDLVSRILDGMQEGGRHEILFDGSALASGTYFVRLQSPAAAKTEKILLLK